MAENKLVVQQKIVDDEYVNTWIWKIVRDDDVVRKSGEEPTFKLAYEVAKKELSKTRG